MSGKWLKALLIVAVVILVTLFARHESVESPPIPQISTPPPSRPIMSSVRDETFEIHRLLRNSTSAHRNRKLIAHACQRIRSHAATLRTSAPDETWRRNLDELSAASSALEQLILSKPEPPLSASRAALDRIVNAYILCDGTLQRPH